MKGYRTMSKQLSGTEIVGKLRQADVLLAQGKTVPEVCREIGVRRQGRILAATQKAYDVKPMKTIGGNKSD